MNRIVSSKKIIPAVIGLLAVAVILLLCFSRRIVPSSRYPGLTRIISPWMVKGIDQPAWAQFPRTITLIGIRDGIHAMLYELNIDNGQLRSLMPNHTVFQYVWAQDRSQLAFWGRDLKNGIDGFGLFDYNKGIIFGQLEPNTGIPFSWSPDKTQLAIYDVCEMPNQQCLLLYNLETREKESVFEFADKNDAIYDISWSPDGKRIAMVFGDPFKEVPNYGIYIIELKSKQARQFISIKSPGTRFSNLRWIRNGEWLIYNKEDAAESTFLLNFIKYPDGKCVLTPLPELPRINDFDVVEIDGNIIFILLDDDQHLYTLDLEMAVAPAKLDQLFQCPNLISFR